MFTKKTIRDIDLEGKTVLLRADYNVPIKDGNITDDYRIVKSLPTIEYLLEKNVKLIICSHLGRPTGPDDTSASLFPVAKRLKQLLDRPVEFATNCIGEPAQKAASGLKHGEVLLLENLRYHAEEKQNDDKFAAKLASLAEIYVDDAFGVVHREDASLVAVTKHLPSVAGLLLEREVESINNVMSKPDKPMMAIIGGAKITDKIEILEKFVKIADIIAIGGAMANTFLAAKGIDVAESLYEKDDIKLAKTIMQKAEEESKLRRFVFALPFDSVVATELDSKSKTRIVDFNTQVLADIEHYPGHVPASASQLHKNEKILDIGPFSASFIAGAIQMCNTVVWNGTMGVTEVASLHGPIGPFAHGTETVIEALLGQMGHKPFTLVGGGDTVGYVESRKLTDSFGHVSTGGGASLELMAGHPLPGVEALEDK